MPESIQEAQLLPPLRETSREHDPGAPISAQLLCGLLMHELRTPLNAVAGFAELLLAGAAGPLTREAVDHVRAIGRAAAAAASALATARELAELAVGRPAALTGEERVDLLPMLRGQGFAVPADAGPGWYVLGPADSWARVVKSCRRYLTGGAGEEPQFAAAPYPAETGLRLRLECTVPSPGDGTGRLELALARSLARRCGGCVEPADDGALVLVAATRGQRKRRRNGVGS